METGGKRGVKMVRKKITTTETVVSFSREELTDILRIYSGLAKGEILPRFNFTSDEPNFSISIAEVKKGLENA